MNQIGHLMLLLSAMLFLACGQVTPADAEEPEPEKPEPTPESGLPSFSRFSLGTTFSIPLTGSLNLAYKDIKKGDSITLQLRSDNTVSYKLECTETSETEGAKFSVPSGFLGAVCNATFDVGGRNITGETFVEVTDTTAVLQKPGKTTYGKVIDLDGKPVKGVSVSDGVMVVVTDDDGCYYMSSLRKNGYVFISVPGGYRVAVNRSIPQFFHRFRSTSSSVYEQHNFIIAREDNARHRVVAFTDCHLANRTNDIAQFEIFKKDLVEQASKAKAEGVPFYAVTLGDLAWDQYWYSNSYSLANYYSTMSTLDIPIYNIPGNHDNDPYVADDFLSENAFRSNIGPTYYSFNIGNVHYVLMDDTIFHNKGGSQGVIGDVQDYEEGFTDNQLKWLKADLEQVPAGSTVMFGTHIQYSTRPGLKTTGQFQYSYSMPATYRAQLLELFSPFNVHILTGHTHIAYTNRFTDKLMEHNIPAVCATWWWTGYYSSNRCFMCRDGAPGGYKIFDISEDSSVKWIYKGMNRDEGYQFRAYDLNNCQITRALYCPTSKTKVSDSFFSQYVHGYDSPRSDNKVLVNVFDYDDKWTVKAMENGKELNVTRVDSYDPLHIIHFNTSRMNTNSTSMTFPTLQTSHLFEISTSSPTSSVTIIVTDAFGRQYSETMSRPRKLYDMSKASNW